MVPFSVCVPGRRIHHELQQRDPGRSAGSHHRVVVYPCSGQVSGAQAVESVRRGPYRRVTEGGAYGLIYSSRI